MTGGRKWAGPLLRVLAGLVLTAAFAGAVSDVAPHSAGLPRLARYAAAHPGTVVFVTQDGPTRVDVRWREGFAREERYAVPVSLTDGTPAATTEDRVRAAVAPARVRFDEADPAFGLGGLGSLFVVTYFRFVPALWLRYAAWAVCLGVLVAIASTGFPGRGRRPGWYAACLLFGAGFWGYLLAPRSAGTGGALRWTAIAAVGLAALATAQLLILNG